MFSALKLFAHLGDLGNFLSMAAIGESIQGGTSGSVLFVGAGPVLAQDNANLFWDATNKVLTVGSGSSVVTANNPVFNGSQTWNNAGIAFTGIKLNIVPTAFNSASLLQDWQVNSSSIASIRNDGVFTLPSEIDFSGSSATFKIAGTSRLNYGVTKSGKWASLTSFVVGNLGNTIANVQQLIIDAPVTSGSAGPTFLFNANNVNGYFGFGAASVSGSDGRFWFGQVDTPYFNTAWDTSTTAGHLSHFEIFNGSLGLGSGGTVDAYISRSASGVLAFGTTTTNGDSGATVKAKTKAGAVVAGDLTAGSWAIIRDTTNLTTKLYYNNAGVLMAVALA